MLETAPKKANSSFTITPPELHQSSGLPPVALAAYPPGNAPFFHHGAGPQPTGVEEGDQAND